MRTTIDLITVRAIALVITACACLLDHCVLAERIIVEYPLEWVGDEAPSANETTELWHAATEFQLRPTNGIVSLERFINDHTNSAWNPALHNSLGAYYRKTGRDTLALSHWEASWLATRSANSGPAKTVADFALAHWTRLLASLGRYETLLALVEETEGRVLDRGHLSQMWARTREAIAEMRLRPGVSYKCGTYALYHAAKSLNVNYDARRLLQIASPSSGFSLKALNDLSIEFGLGLVPVVRESGQALAVPCVVHWRQDHYAAIVGQKGQLFRVVDPTFGPARYMTLDAINAEASGAFLVPGNRVPVGYRSLSSEETRLIFGKGNPNFHGDGDDQTHDCDDGEAPPGSDGPEGDDYITNGNLSGGSSCGGCFTKGAVGMPRWRVSEPYINLWLEDEPLGYQPPLGPRISLNLRFKQRAEDSLIYTFSSVGEGWDCSWLSAINASWYYRYGYFDDFAVFYGGGGVGAFSDADNVSSNYYNSKKMVALTNHLGLLTNFHILSPNGAKDVYGFRPTNAFGSGDMHYLSERISPEGYITRFIYEDYDPGDLNVRLKYVVDPNNGTNTIYYATDGYSLNLITNVTDPFGRTTYLKYDEDGLLTNIIDVAGISNNIAYNEHGWPTNLTTPYGPTRFDHFDLSFEQQYAVDRSVTITLPNGGKHIYAFLGSSLLETNDIAEALMPTNTPIGTLDNSPQERLSYHWNPLQYVALSSPYLTNFIWSDYLKGRMRHWLGATVHGDARKMDTLSIQREASPDGVTEGQWTYYDYVNKNGPWPQADQGDHILPAVIARVLPDGSTWYTWYQRNEWFVPTNIVNTYTKPDGTIGLRTNVLIRAGNGIDLVTHIGPNGEQVVSNYFGNACHQPDASYDALDQETLYTYNALRQLIKVVSPSGLTTTNSYSSAAGASSNWLVMTVDLEISRTNKYTYTNHLVESHTDERGLTTSNYWDNLQRLVAVKYPDGTTVSNFYAILDLTAVKDRLGCSNRFGYNSVRQRIAETNANGVVTRYGYCDCGALLSVTNAWSTPVQQVTTFVYDLQGNRLISYGADEYNVTNWYDSLKRPIVTGDGTGYRWFYYNNQGLKTAVSNAFGIERNTVFDIDDRGIYVTDSNGVIITNTYDDLGRLQTRTQPNGEAETFGYSARGLIVYTNQLNLTNWYAYDQAGRKIFETNSNNELIRYTNNAAGDLLSLTDGKDQTTRWNYDEYGHVTNKVDQANAEILRYAYAPGGRLTNRWSAAKGNTVYSYDPVANLTNINYPSSTDVRFQYDWLDRVTNMVDAVGTTKYTYTAGGQLASEDGPLPTDTVSNTYTNRLRIALNLQQPTEAWTNAFAYDAARRLTNVTSPAGSFAYQFTAGVPSLLPIKISLPNTAYVTNAYDSLARLAGTYLKNSSHTTLDSYVYVYDPASQRTNLTRTDNSTVAYSYDKIGQLKVANSSVNSEDRGYAYDKAWNLVFRTNNGALSTFFVDNRNQVTNVSAADDYTYDANGNTVGVWGMFTYEYDDENRLTAIEVPEDWRSEFKYDGLGRLRARTEMTTWLAEEGVFVDSIVTYFIYDGYRVVQERVAPNSPSVSYTRGADLSGSLEGARGIGGLLARSDGYSSGNWTTHNFYHADGNGNITYLVNNSQSLAASYRYDPFGKLISSSGSLAGANTYRFSSKEAYDNSGLYYFGYRWYDWNLQRWITRDPIHELGFLSTRGRKAGWHAEAEANLYCFVRNEPNANTDPSGLKKRFFGLTGGTCCNYSGSSEWWLDGQTWKKLKDGDCTGTFDDCDGLTCSGAFYAVPEFGSGQCNGPGSCTTTGPEKQKSVDSPFRTPLEGWTPGSGLGVPPIWDPVRKIGRGASDLPPDYVWIM